MGWKQYSCMLGLSIAHPYILYLKTQQRRRWPHPQHMAERLIQACITARAGTRRLSSGIGSSRRLRVGQLLRAGPMAT